MMTEEDWLDADVGKLLRELGRKHGELTVEFPRSGSGYRIPDYRITVGGARVGSGDSLLRALRMAVGLGT